jgi:uncharacterized membrane protein (DUF373 family)
MTYLTAAALLVVAAGLTAVGTIIDHVEGSESRRIADAGLFVLDRVLLVFIIGELLFTLRTVNLGGRLLVEPFLIIGLIAVVREVLVVAAEAGHRDTAPDDVVLQIGALSALALVLSISIFLLRRSRLPTPEAGLSDDV